jgi:DNA-binding NtrC family response regulator
MPRLLVVDDEPSILHFFRRAFPGPEVTLLTANTAAEGVAAVTRERPDAVVLDISLPDETGLEAFRTIHRMDPKIPVIFITGHGTAATAIEAMRLGAYEYLLKPLELDHLCDVVDRAFEISRFMRVPAVLQESGDVEQADALVGHCPAMQEVYKAIGRVAPQDATVLILGESGTGKELVARAIYHYSARANKPFLAINCAAIPETLLESELFGHEKGAFTGAERRRIGKFEQCHGGTLFLDEIGDMTPLTQSKVLRVIQGQEFERVGGNEPIRADVRLIAATHRDLEKMVAGDAFRGDLFYRLNVFSIKLPPLRDRGDDLPLLVEHFLKRFGRELGKEVRGVAAETLELFRRYPWPGHIPELESVCLV